MSSLLGIGSVAPALSALMLGATLAAAWGGKGPAPMRLDTAVRLPTALRGSLQNPCWSPRSDRLALTQWDGFYNSNGNARMRIVSWPGGKLLATPTPTIGAQSVNLPGSCWNRVTGQITYASDESGHDEVYVGPPTGHFSQATRLTHPPQVAFEPSLSPDGRWVAFESHIHGAAGEIWKVRIDGSGLRQLTRRFDDREPNWSPSGDRIVFQREPAAAAASEAGPWDLWTIAPAGSRATDVTQTPSLNETDPSWSPDGGYIVFSSDGPGIDIASLFVVPAQGGRRRQITHTRGIYDGAPSWSPDGARIAFESTVGDPDSGGARAAIWTIAAPPGARRAASRSTATRSAPGFR